MEVRPFPVFLVVFLKHPAIFIGIKIITDV